MSKFDAILCLLLSPFVASVLVIVAIAVAYVFQVERTRRRPYPEPADLAEWRDRNWRGSDAS